MEIKKQTKWLLLLSGIGILALGITTIARPHAGLITLAIFFGVVLLFAGISEIAAYSSRDKANRSGGMLASGILSVLFGIWIMFGRGMAVVATIIPFIFAIWVMASGITRIADSLSPKDGGKRSVWQLVLAIISTMFGFVLMFNPVMSAVVVSIITSIMLIAFGIGTIHMFFVLRKGIPVATNENEIVADGKVIETE